MVIGTTNDAWLLAWAKDIHVAVTMPESFSSSYTGTNECEINFGTLHDGDRIGSRLTVTVFSNISPKNYTISINVSGGNVLEKIFTPKVIVVT